MTALRARQHESRDLDMLIFPEGWRDEALPRMSSIIRDSFSEAVPPFLQQWYGDRYRSFALSAEWLAHSFVANAVKEAEGAVKLWRIAGEARNLPFAAAVVTHASDEARHARMYMAMLDLAFPGALEGETRESVAAMFPAYRRNSAPPEDVPPRPLESLLDDLVQMNIGEIRTRIHQMLLRPVALAVAPPANRDRLVSILDRIYADEGSHIIYTAETLERYAGAGSEDRIRSLYRRRLADFSAITIEEVGVGQFD